MKKFVFCVALVAAMVMAIPAHAQFKIGPKVGVNISNLSIENGIGANFESDNISSFTGGVMAEFIVPVIGLGVDASVMYTRKGSKLSDLTNKDTETRHIDFIEIPINLKYKFSLPVVSSITTPFIYAGPSFAFRVGDNFKDQLESRSFETSINLGIGFEFFNHLQIAGQYGWGLNNVFEKSDDSTLNSIIGSAINGKSRAWTVTVAYLF